MTPFASFTFASQRPRRSPTVADVMPINPGLACAVVLGDAYLHRNGNDTHLTCFPDLCEALSIGSATEALQAARAEGQLSEGNHILPSDVRDYLGSLGQGPIFVRGWAFGSSSAEISTHLLVQLSEVLSTAKFEEVEVCDASEIWYLRCRDDDPLIFLSLTRERVAELVRCFPDTCLEVESDFLYSA